jgi:riboflavin synthase
MFSGIVEETAHVLSVNEMPGGVRVAIQRPNNFKDLKLGDSIAMDGVCLTVEACDEASIQFFLSAETLRVTGWSQMSLQNRPLNLEQSIRYGDRVHGHFVTGHVDGRGTVTAVTLQGEAMQLTLRLDSPLVPFFWHKGACSVNGVSLTVNNLKNDSAEFWLIPETLKRTTLRFLKVGDVVNIETDWMARGLVNFLQNKGPSIESSLHS